MQHCMTANLSASSPLNVHHSMYCGLHYIVLLAKLRHILYSNLLPQRMISMAHSSSSLLDALSCDAVYPMCAEIEFHIAL